MNNIVLEKVWTQNSPIVVDNLIGTTVTGESEAHTFRVRGVDADQEPVAITGTITGKLLNANNDTVALTGSLSNGIASVTLTETCYAVPGRFIVSIFATNADVTQCLYCGVGNVFRASSSSIAYPTDSLPDITSLMADLEEILDGWPADYSQIESDVNTLKTKVGTTSMGTTATTVTGAVKEINDEVGDLKSHLHSNGINKPFNIRYSVELNKYLRKSDGTIVSNSGLVSKITDYVPCEAGDIFGYYGLGSGSIASVVWYDISMAFISAEQYNYEIIDADHDPQSITAPSGAKYARFSSYKYGSDGSTVVLYVERTIPTSFGIETDFAKLRADSNLIINQYWDTVTHDFPAVPYTAYQNKKLNGSDGTVVTASGVVSKITDFVPCKSGDIYNYNGYGSGTLSSVCFYDIDKKFVSSAVYNSEPYYTPITIPANIYYVRFASNKFGADTSAVIFGVYKEFGKSFDAFQTLAGKKWLVIGDSWVASSTLGAGVRNFVEYVREKTKVTLYNKGVGGTGYWMGHQNNSAYYQRVPNLTEEADIVSVFGSLNDMGTDGTVYGSQILGTYTDNTTDTVCGCINATLDALETKYPNALINIITPCPWSNSHDNDYPNQYVNAIKQICEYRSIPCLDLFHGSSLRPWDDTFLSTFYVDGAHANTLGHKRFSGMVQKFIEAVCYIDN